MSDILDLLDFYGENTSMYRMDTQLRPYDIGYPTDVVSAAVSAAKAALSLHDSYDPAQALLLSQKPQLDGTLIDELDGHSAGAVGGKASTFAGAEVFDFGDRITSGSVTELTKFFCFKTSSATTQTICGEWLETGNQRSWIATVTSTGKLRVRISADGGDSNIKDYVTTASVTGSFQRCGFTFDNGTLKVFVKGAEAAVTKTTDATVSSIYNSTSDFQIGSHTGGTDDFTGQISFLIGWSGTVLTAHDMAVLADSLTLPSTIPSWLFYPIGDKCHDLTDNLSTVTGTATITGYSDPDVPVAKDFDLDSYGYRFAGGEYIPRRLNSDLATDGNALTASGRARKPGQLRKGNAVVFSGSEVITVPNSTDFSGSDWTLSGYVAIDSLGATNQVILSQLDGTGTGQNWLYKNDADEWATAISGTEQTFTNALAAGKVYEFELSKSGTTYTLTTINHTDDIAAVSDSVTATMQAADGAIKIGADKAEANELTGKMFGIELDHADGFHLPMCERSGVTFHDVKNGKICTGTATLTHTDTVNEVFHWPEAKGYSPIWDVTSATDGAIGPEIAGAPIESDVSISFEIKTTDVQGIVFGDSAGGLIYLLAFTNGNASTNLFGGSGTPTLTVGGVDLSSGNRDGLHTAMCTGNWVTVSMTGVDLSGYTSGLFLAGYDNSAFRWDGQVRNLVINGVAYGGGQLLIPAKEDGSADALGNEIQFPAGAKTHNTGVDVDYDPDGIYQFGNNLHQGMTGDGVGYLTLKNAITLSGAFEISFRAYSTNFDQSGMVIGSSSATLKFGFLGTASGVVFVRVIGGGSSDTTTVAPAAGEHEFILTRNDSDIVVLTIDGTDYTLFSGAAQAGDMVLDQIFSDGSNEFTGRIRNLKIIDDGSTVLDMSGKNLLDLSGQANHAEITADGVTFDKLTLSDHAFGDTPEIPQSIDQSTSGEEKQFITFEI